MDFSGLSLADLRIIAKEKGLKGISALKKSDLIAKLEAVEKETEQTIKRSSQAKEAGNIRETGNSRVINNSRENNIPRENSNSRENGTVREMRNYRESREDYNKKEENRRELSYRENMSYQQRENNTAPSRSGRNFIQSFDPNDISSLDSGEVANGILEVMPDGFGFIRCENYLPGDHDVYVSPAQIRRFNLRTGDIIKGNIRIKTEREKFSALLYVSSVNGFSPQDAQRRKKFEDMTPIFPNDRIRLETQNASVSMRIVDLLSPIGKGQRGMIVSPPKTGKTTLLKEIAKSISRTYKDMNLIVLLIDERPEEVTDIRESIEGPNVEVIYSTFDELPEHHKRVSEMVLERAKRLVEHKKDVVILLDSITRLARAYNLTVPPSGRTLTGGLDPAALHMPKKFFGAARNMREGGSLTILATALVETGSKMDDVVFEEFKGTGNMELVLDRKLSEKRIFPAVDIQKSSTRRDDLLLDREEQEVVYALHKELSGARADDNLEQILNFFLKTKNNKEFIHVIQNSLMKH
ncbi:MAG: transcription termination factor Rho [Lachnospiraceae bacterium]|nr:transcription termination factor Rho [Lachnospiraceae bacterium]